MVPKTDRRHRVESDDPAAHASRVRETGEARDVVHHRAEHARHDHRGHGVHEDLLNEGEHVVVKPLLGSIGQRQMQQCAEGETAQQRDQGIADVVFFLRVHVDGNHIPSIDPLVAQHILVRAEDHRAVIVLRACGPVLCLGDRIVLRPLGGEAHAQLSESAGHVCGHRRVRIPHAELDCDFLDQQQRLADLLFRSALGLERFGQLPADRAELPEIHLEDLCHVYSMVRMSAKPVISKTSITASCTPVKSILPCLFMTFWAESSTRRPAEEM